MGFEQQVNAKISQGVRQAMQVVIKKIDSVIQLKCQQIVQSVEAKQKSFEHELLTKIYEIDERLQACLWKYGQNELGANNTGAEDAAMKCPEKQNTI